MLGVWRGVVFSCHACLLRHDDVSAKARLVSQATRVRTREVFCLAEILGLCARWDDLPVPTSDEAVNEDFVLRLLQGL